MNGRPVLTITQTGLLDLQKLIKLEVIPQARLKPGRGMLILVKGVGQKSSKGVLIPPSMMP